MLFSTTTLLLGALLPPLALSAPTTAMGSKKNVYLVRCEPSDCSDYDCDIDELRITAAAYFANGPINEGNTRAQKPTSLATLNGNNKAWEGTKRTFRFGSAGTFTTNISTAAKTSTKGAIAGDATLGTEPFVCFKDGATKIAISYDGDQYTCSTDYWCPSVDVGTEGEMLA